MTFFSLLQNTDKKYVTFPFYKEESPLPAAHPLCGITLRAAGTMRFRWNEQNPARASLLAQIANDRIPTPVQLNHTRLVYNIHSPEDTLNKIGDGIITTNKKIMPVVTVADCVPIYLYECEKKVFGIVHSGWKGTGIVEEAISLANKEYGAKAENFCVVIGPHIHNCCYIVDQNRAQYFIENFGAECVKKLEEGVKVDWNNGDGPLYRLSLEKANLAALKRCGVREENIAVCSDCTSCNEIYGSNRRETKLAGKPDAFTVQAAFVISN